MSNCAGCRYVGFLNGELVCRAAAPVAHIESCPDPECSDFAVHTVFPGVDLDQFCGEYAPSSIGYMNEIRETYEAIQNEIEDEARALLGSRESNIVTLRTAKPKGNA